MSEAAEEFESVDMSATTSVASTSMEMAISDSNTNEPCDVASSSGSATAPNETAVVDEGDSILRSGASAKEDIADLEVTSTDDGVKSVDGLTMKNEIAESTTDRESNQASGSEDRLHHRVDSNGGAIAGETTVSEGVSVRNDGKKMVDPLAQNEWKQRRRERAQLYGTAFLLAQLRSGSVAQQGDSDEDTSADENNDDADVRPNDKAELDTSSHRRLPSNVLKETERRRQASSALEECEQQKKAKVSLAFNFESGVCSFREVSAFHSVARGNGFSVGTTENNYIRSCKWNTDGRLLAVSSQDRNARIFRFTNDTLSLNLCSTVALGDLIYDICWHPSEDWLATSSKAHPIHLWDSSGSRTVSFQGINRLDELDSAYSLCFSVDGMILYGGFRSIIRKFDIRRPGRHVSEISTWAKNVGGQKGIISSIAMNPAMRGVYAAGCYGKMVAVYSEMSSGAECFFESTSPAVTQLMFSHDGNYLYTASRKDNLITCWDMRNPGRILGTLRRPSSTSQRIYFDICGENRYLFSGSSTGDLYVFELAKVGAVDVVEPLRTLNASRSAVAAISLHPSEALVAAGSGQRVFPFPRLDDDPLEEDLQSGYEAVNTEELLDNSLSLWSFANRTC